MGYIKQFIVGSIPSQMEYVINDMLEESFLEEIQLDENIKFSTKLVKTPKFGGIKTKKMRLYLEGKLINSFYQTMLIEEDARNKYNYLRGNDFLKIMLTSRTVDRAANLLMDNILDQ